MLEHYFGGTWQHYTVADSEEVVRPPTAYQLGGLEEVTTPARPPR